MKSADGDSNGTIEYSEFEKLISDINLYQEEDLQDTCKKKSFFKKKIYKKKIILLLFRYKTFFHFIFD